MDRASFPSRHFALRNPVDDGPEDLPKLLRRVADEVDLRGISPDDILDLTVSGEIEDFGLCWSVSVYWEPDDS